MERYFWVVAIAVTLANAAYMVVRSKPYIQADPDLADGYAALVRGYALWLNIPWVVMGFGLTIGGVPSIWAYLRPPGSNPFILAWYASILLLWVSGAWWILLGGGAEMLVKYPGAFRMNAKRPGTVKVLWLIMQAGGIAGLIFLWSNPSIPLP